MLYKEYYNPKDFTIVKCHKNKFSIMLPLARIGETLGEDIANYFIILGLMLFAMFVYALFSKKDEK